MTVVPILLYHSISSDPASGIKRFAVSPDTFRSHLDVMTGQGVRPLTVSELVDARRRVRRVFRTVLR